MTGGQPQQWSTPWRLKNWSISRLVLGRWVPTCIFRGFRIGWALRMKPRRACRKSRDCREAAGGREEVSSIHLNRPCRSFAVAHLSVVVSETYINMVPSPAGTGSARMGSIVTGWGYDTVGKTCCRDGGFKRNRVRRGPGPRSGGCGGDDLRQDQGRYRSGGGFPPRLRTRAGPGADV